MLSVLDGRSAAKPDKPNIIYLMWRLAYYELSWELQIKLQTLIVLREGLRFTNALAASPVCAPLRCNLSWQACWSCISSKERRRNSTSGRRGHHCRPTQGKRICHRRLGKWGCGGGIPRASKWLWWILWLLRSGSRPHLLPSIFDS